MCGYILQVLAHQRHLEQLWHGKKVKLHQRLGLRLFQQDVKQVQCLIKSDIVILSKPFAI